MSQEEASQSDNVPRTTTAALFEQAVRDHSRRLLAIARAVVGNRASAEDVVQQALTNLYQHRDRYDWREPGGLMRRSVVNEALRVLRHPRMASVADDHVMQNVSIMGGLIDRETIQQVRDAIDRLPEHFRAALVLCEYENMDYAQIAQVLDASIPQVKTWLHRGRRQLARMLEKNGEQPLNAIDEFDLELLEDYLDDALSPSQVERVGQRLADEPELARAMYELRTQRALRIVAFRSLEPAEHETQRVVDGISRVVQRERRTKARRAMIFGSAIAASMAVFITGWIVAFHLSHVGANVSLASKSNKDGHPVSGTSFNVALVDSQGHVIPVERFARMDDAREFAQDLVHYEARLKDAEQGSAMLVSDRF